MLQDLFDNDINNALKYIKMDCCNEIRLRLNMPIVITIAGENLFLGKFGVTNNPSQALICAKEDISHVIDRASNNSLYSINDQLINGYISYTGGIRIGVAGEFVYVEDKIKTIKNIQGLNIRLPHEVNNCSLSTLKYVLNNDNISNTLVLSPAGAGKTTYIRDLVKQLLKNSKQKNILVVDERCEITGIANGHAMFGGMNCDILSNCKKKYAFDNGIRSLKPDVIVTDELSCDDIASVENAMTYDVKIIATIHASSIVDLKNKPQFSDILSKHLFDRYIVLGTTNGRAGTLLGVYNSNLECIGL